MQQTIENIHCPTHFKKSCRTQPFRAIKYTFQYQSEKEDKRIISYFLQKGFQLAQKVNPKAANNGTQERKFTKIVNNCIAGLLAEGLWRHYLNQEKELVTATTMQDAKAQIDLKILANHKKIEVRSSFPRNGIPFAICHPTKQFDILGFYSNSYKPGEVQKDYYVRTLFHLGVKKYWKKDGREIPIMEKLVDKAKKDNFEVYLTGGATWQMMTNDQISLQKNLIPEDEFTLSRLKNKSLYRVVPFSQALDSVEVYELIKGEQSS